MRRNRYYIIVAVFLFLGLAIYYQWRSSSLLANKGKYTIGTIDKMKPSGNGIRIFISFFYQGKKEEVDYIQEVGFISRFYIGKRFFIKFIPNNDRAIAFNIDCAVPDSIQSAPLEGWP